MVSTLSGGTLLAENTLASREWVRSNYETTKKVVDSLPYNYARSGGNTWNAPLTIGTKDNYDVRISTNDTQRVRISAAGHLSVASNLYNNYTGSVNGQLNLANTGAAISRAVSDANPSLLLNRINGTGNIQTWSNNGSTIAKMDVSGNFTTTKYLLSNLNTPPSSATDTGITGEVRITSSYIYVCIATNTWVRAGLATW